MITKIGMRGSKRMPLLQMFQLVHLISIIIIVVVLLIKEASSASNYSMAKPNCPVKCGDLRIPYPFGIGKGCYLNKKFEVTCNKSTLYYSLSHVQVFRVSLDHHYATVDGQAAVLCHDNKSGESFIKSLFSNLDQEFRISGTQNKLVAIGCDFFTYITEFESAEYISGCSSLCYNASRDNVSVPSSLDYNINHSSCSGIGCCQTSLPKDLFSFVSRSLSINTEGRSWASKPCNIAFIAEKNFTEFSKFNKSIISGVDHSATLRGVPTVIDWAVGNISCHEARARPDYVCGPNSYCIESSSSYGMTYRCHCSQGYQGNPYLQINGCQDIDECKDPNKYPCPKGALCKNTEGSYLCPCPSGHKSDGNGTGCIPDHGRQLLALIIPLAFGIAIGILLLIATGFWLHREHKKRQKNKIKKNFFKRNGGLLLQQQTSSSTDSVARTKLFIIEELEKATDNFSKSRFLGQGGLGTVYKGMLSDGSIVAIKKSNKVDETQVGQFINEVIILSQINHRNIVKLLGCCLETEVPILVYEYVSNGTLSEHLHDEDHASMSWDNRLRVAREIAGALAYLHSYASTAIFHRDIKSSNILLDENYRAVVSDFGLSRSVPLHQTHLTTLVGGTFGYLDPEYFRSGQLTDKSDVYAFGVVLAELLTGEKAVSSKKFDEGLVLHFQSSMKQNRLFEIVEPRVMNDGKEEEIEAIATLTERCLKLNAKKRPNMKEVEAELDQLRKLREQPLLKQNSEDNYSLVSERSHSDTIDAVEE